MKGPFWTPFRRKLLISYPAAVMVGIAAGAVFWASRGGAELRALHEQVVHQAVARAGDLAFRFGTAEHARALLSKVPVEGAEPALMMAQIELAVLDGEHLDGAKSTKHLELAARACPGFDKPSCDVESLRGLAKRLAEKRRD